MYNKQVQKMISTLYKQLVREEKKGSLLCSIKMPLKRTSVLTGISISTVKKWVSDGEKEDDEKTAIRKAATSFDNFDVDIITRKMKLLFDSGSFITLKKLKEALREDHGMNTSKTSL